MSFYHRSDPDELFDRSLAKYVPYGNHAISDKAILHPNIDVYEMDLETIIHVEIPGINKQDVSVTGVQDGNLIVLSGFSKREATIRDEHLLIHERRFGSFYRPISLPRGSESGKAKAKFEDGLLTITVPKSNTTSSKISIE
ncbi:hypothetical protein DSO57_1013132 [Entomophthora muscae]|uniref:Uncharacterized protein n=1 Tax=Entomophthora muscae TaxID=34485 RepID=A0ACC2SUZ4_9FUNG|nr:hypothetical protein DSO57_1013132 [Entomophthora muscae]